MNSPMTGTWRTLSIVLLALATALLVDQALAEQYAQPSSVSLIWPRLG